MQTSIENPHIIKDQERQTVNPVPDIQKDKGANMSTSELFYEKSSEIVARVIEGEVLLVPIRNNIGDLQCIYTTDGVGGRIWELLDGQRSSNEIIENLASEYDKEIDDVRNDFQQFMDQLVQAGCVKEIVQANK